METNGETRRSMGIKIGDQIELALTKLFRSKYNVKIGISFICFLNFVSGNNNAIAFL